MLRRLFFPFLLMLLLTGSSLARDYNWYKGNIHCHTNRSDGVSPPERVVQWYKDHGYQFLIVTDHNKITDTKGFSGNDFITIPGEEVTDGFQKIPIHVNGFNISKEVVPQKGSSITETLQNNITAIREAGGIAQVNHPLWKWAFDEKSIAPLKGVSLLEVYNFNWECNNYAAGGSVGTEMIWDRLLSRGMKLYATATDDAHIYEADYDPRHPYPGRAWIMVRAHSLTTDNIILSLSQGNFYASTGVLLRDIRITDSACEIEIKPVGDNRYSTFFIGKGGKVLKKVDGARAAYTFTARDSYVRAKIVSTGGDFALTQPHFVKK